MAVAPTLRRQGLGRLMMQAGSCRFLLGLPSLAHSSSEASRRVQAADELCRAAGQERLTLHLRCALCSSR